MKTKIILFLLLIMIAVSQISCEATYDANGYRIVHVNQNPDDK